MTYIVSTTLNRSQFISTLGALSVSLRFRARGQVAAQWALAIGLTTVGLCQKETQTAPKLHSTPAGREQQPPVTRVS